MLNPAHLLEGVKWGGGGGGGGGVRLSNIGNTHVIIPPLLKSGGYWFTSVRHSVRPSIRPSVIP